jgi:hypothetical protein
LNPNESKLGFVKLLAKNETNFNHEYIMQFRFSFKGQSMEKLIFYSFAGAGCCFLFSFCLGTATTSSTEGICFLSSTEIT